MLLLLPPRTWLSGVHIPTPTYRTRARVGTGVRGHRTGPRAKPGGKVVVGAVMLRHCNVLLQHGYRGMQQLAAANASRIRALAPCTICMAGNDGYEQARVKLAHTFLHHTQARSQGGYWPGLNLLWISHPLPPSPPCSSPKIRATSLGRPEMRISVEFASLCG